MYVKDIEEVKSKFRSLQEAGRISGWELPYENLLTRLTAAIFFAGFDAGESETVAEVFSDYAHFHMRPNSEKKLSSLPYRITFNAEEKKS